MKVTWNDERFRSAIDAAVFARTTNAAQLVEERAKTSMRGGGYPHRPSTPGTPPNIDTGALRRSGEHNVITDGHRVRGFVRFGGPGVPYGLAQEFGNRRLPARPYLRPALEKSRGDILRLIRVGRQ